MIKKEQILEATDRGLDIILRLYPDAQRSVGKKNVKFKIREEEKTASATLRLDKGEYCVTDFGGDQKQRNAIDCWMKERNKTQADFFEVLKEIAAEFGLSEDGTKPVFRKAEYSSNHVKKADGTYPGGKVKLNDKLLGFLGKIVTLATCELYGVTAIDGYATVKDNVEHSFKATDEFPIYLIDYGPFKKIYQPFAEKKYRFMHIGERPKDFVGGWIQLQKAVQNGDTFLVKNSFFPEKKIKDLIICSGESDSLNVASAGYHVIWLNSETAKLTKEQYKYISTHCENIYCCYDLDETGLRASHELCSTYLDIRRLILPAELKTYKDQRGNPCKDAKDFFKHFSENRFENLLRISYPYRFWDFKIKRNAEGAITEIRHTFNQAHVLDFLAAHGYYRLKSKNTKTGFIFVYLKNHLVTEVDYSEIKTFINSFIRNRHLDVDIINMVLNTNRLSEGALLNLPEIELDFTKADKHSQMMFFPGCVWKITADKIEHIKGSAASRFVWKDEVITPDDLQVDVKLTDPFFDIKETAGEFEIKTLRKHPFFQFLINSARIHWRKEFDGAGVDHYQDNEYYQNMGLNDISSKHLDDHENAEQMAHLVNRIFTIGYLLHTFKEPSRPWAVFSMDNTVSDVHESHGGSGKSVCFGAIRYFLKNITLNGRNAKLTENNHVFENVTPHTKFIFVDDCKHGLDFSFFFNLITGDMEVNPKHAKQFTIPFKNSPKLCFTSNYALRHLDPSTERRLLYTVNSDFYHHKSDRAHQSRSPKDDLGLTLFAEFTADQWNDFYNFCAQCVQFYLGNNKIDPPMANVQRRNLRNEMGDTFFNWANDYLEQKVQSPDCVNRGLAFSRKDAQLAFEEYNANKKITGQRFSKATIAWCKFWDYELNPSELTNSQNRIVNKEGEKSVEMFFIRRKIKNEEDSKLIIEDDDFDSIPSDYNELPFMKQ